MEDGDLKWYEAVLKECKSLDINDFLHDVSQYVTNRPLPPICTAAITGGQGAPSPFVPPIRLIKTEIFHHSHERKFSQYTHISGDDLDGHLFFEQGNRRFNQFGSMERVFSGFDFLSNPGAASFPSSEPESLS